MLFKAFHIDFCNNGEHMAENLMLKRRFENVFVCQNCNATNRFGTGKPTKCRKCGSSRLRPKKKKKKSGA